MKNCESQSRINASQFRIDASLLLLLLLLLLIITYLTRVNLSAEAVINGCPGQINNEQFKEKITITDQLSEKCKNYVQCRWIKTKNCITT